MQGQEQEAIRLPIPEVSLDIPFGEASPAPITGRPRLDLTEEERAERKRQQKRDSARRARERKKKMREGGEKED